MKNNCFLLKKMFCLWNDNILLLLNGYELHKGILFCKKCILENEIRMVNILLFYRNSSVSHDSTQCHIFCWKILSLFFFVKYIV